MASRAVSAGGEASQPAMSSDGRGSTPLSGRTPRNDVDSHTDAPTHGGRSTPKHSHPKQRHPPRSVQPPVHNSTSIENPTQPDAQPKSQQKSQRQSRRGKFKATLTEPLDAQTSEKRQSKPKEAGKPTGDDLTSTLTHALRTRPYPDCPICFNSIRPEQPTWSCSPSTRTLADDNEEGSHCLLDYSVRDLEEAWRARGETRPGEWRCPGCQAKRHEVPHVYLCFCRRMHNPSPPRLATPHSCAQPCSRPRLSGCEHSCPLPCHPGPCPPCAVTVQRACLCGKELCKKPLLCGNSEHRCTLPCHLGLCSPCLETEELRCWCGRETKNAACGEVKIEDSTKCIVAKNSGSSEEVWIGRYGCEQPCNRPFACSYHLCPKPCHPPSRIPPPCPFDPERILTCACGRCRVSRSSDELAGSSGDSSCPILPPRNSCTSPLPTCTSPCSKPMQCGHLCKATCHWDTCPPCIEQVERTCRCGSTKRKVLCGAAVSEPTRSALASREIICDRACTALRACGRHQCGRVCCPLASVQRSRAKKRRDPALATDELEELGTEEGGLHECDLPCNRVMGCGNHRCPRRDHKGNCGVCLRSVFQELMCPCERTVLEPPISCGTTVNCMYPCARPPPSCGHPRVPHLCHEAVVVAGADTADEGLGPEGTAGTGACPPCPSLTSKICACGKKMIDNVRCSQERPSDVLNGYSSLHVLTRLLACGFHHCERLCHADECGACTAICGKSRKSWSVIHLSHHPCTQTCHAPTSCPETEPCLTPITLTCPCGHLRSTVPCSGNKLLLKCTGECAIVKRNARLAEALGISDEKRDAIAAGTKVTWSDELVAFARVVGNAKFVSVVERTFSDFVTSERRMQVLPHMPLERRKFVHDLASVYRMDTTMVDQEPLRSVQLIRRIDSRIPTPLLSQYVTSSTSFRGGGTGSGGGAGAGGRVRRGEVEYGCCEICVDACGRVCVGKPIAARRDIACTSRFSGGWIWPGVGSAAGAVKHLVSVQVRLGRLRLVCPVPVARAQGKEQEYVPDDWEDDV
ncbi:hypothetical protein BU15DRAFT_87666 [Melanogaster broomeanus]|nr:hypothetical protein BU15DRAFT_87666 [Melanogaster broomeanus]